MSMERLSSRATALWKIVFPVFWIGGFVAADVGLLVGGFDPAPPEMKIIFPAVTVAGSLFICWFGLRLKNVYRDGEDLLVGNFRKLTRVPLSVVARVRQVPFLSPPTVVIEFKSPTVFGKSIRFVPRSRWEGPAVGTLREAARRDSAAERR